MGTTEVVFKHVGKQIYSLHKELLNLSIVSRPITVAEANERVSHLESRSNILVDALKGEDEGNFVPDKSISEIGKQ